MAKKYDYFRSALLAIMNVFVLITSIYSIVKLRTIDYWLLRLSWILLWSVIIYNQSENHYIKHHPDQKVKWGARLIIFCSLIAFSVSATYNWHPQKISFSLLWILLVVSWILRYISKRRYKVSSEAFVEWLKQAEESHWLSKNKKT